MKHSGLTKYTLRAVVMIGITSVLIPQCLPRPVALQVEEGGMTPPLRKIMTNLTSVTVSTGDVAFLLLLLAPPFPVLPWLAVPSRSRPLPWGLHPQLSCLHLTSHHLLLLPLWPRCFCTRKSNRGGLPALGAVLLPRAVPSFVAFLQLFHSLVSLSSIPYFSISENCKQKYNSKSSSKGTWLLYFSFVSL